MDLETHRWFKHQGQRSNCLTPVRVVSAYANLLPAGLSSTTFDARFSRSDKSNVEPNELKLGQHSDMTQPSCTAMMDG